MRKTRNMTNLRSVKVAVLVAISFNGIAACKPIKGAGKRAPIPKPVIRMKISCFAALVS